MKLMIWTVGGIVFALLGSLAFAGYFDRDVLVRVPATASPSVAHRHLAAVYVSGDAGYKVAMGRMIGSRLAADGIPVLAINSLGYFRQHRTVAEVSALTAETIRQALVFGHADQVVLIGHSLGADTLQAALVQLPQDLRRKVRAVVLIVPTDALYLQVSPGEMLGWSKPDGAILPTLQQLTWVPTTCIFGMDETSSPCPHLGMPNVRKVGLPGGHSLDWNLSRVHAALIEAIDDAAPDHITNASQRDHLLATMGSAKAQTSTSHQGVRL
jgi:type IV secretory pathway VirJ component